MTKSVLAAAMVFLLSCGTTADRDRPVAIPQDGAISQQSIGVTFAQPRILMAEPDSTHLRIRMATPEPSTQRDLLDRFPTLLVTPDPNVEYFILKAAPDPNVEYTMPMIGQEEGDASDRVYEVVPQPGGVTIPQD